MISLEEAVDEREFRAAMTRLAKCAAVTTALGPAGPVGCTTTSLMSLSVAPPSVLVAFQYGSRTLDDIQAAGRFVINVLSHEQGSLVRRFATGSARERFRGLEYTVAHGAPLLSGAAVSLVCDLQQSLRALDHILLVGSVRDLRAAAAAPLVLVTGEPHTTVPALPRPTTPDDIR
ncbi:flavin reductase family protein [Streptomyces candidus]|uniref:Flavin reductase (DIM6/NTAB) family NADH-FMN oxidoreductase RutF n=1 Tax=Streptomyces candidus TaxID=67283 RepID=A0A7X0HJ34_9ACTN|nr:flavin reductase family protein [Streptomyces candidus]MBB6438617.1 flavin reductase (DIM6/NTAB) family NADH-FMN oxidoreductase RutF [Streptomyces candidus]GHH45303.1 flavin reductase [Streptomyces candidus]